LNGKERSAKMDTFMIVWVIVQMVIIIVTAILLIRLHKPKHSIKKDKNRKEKK